MGALFNLLFPWLAHGEMLKVGDTAPEFSTTAVLGDQATPVKLSDYRGRKVVLYFYPKDNTPGCTKEACTFRDGYNDLQRWGIVLLGCSIDSADNHRALYVPERFAHGYQALEDATETSYQVGEFYAPGTEGGLSPFDPRLGLKWPLPVTVISPKDSAWKHLEEVEREVKHRMSA